MNFTAACLAEQLKGEVAGDGSVHRPAKWQWAGIQQPPEMIVRVRALDQPVAALAARFG